MAPEDTFVIAVRLDRRSDVRPDWKEIVRSTSGVTIVGDASPFRVQVRATPEAIARVTDQLPDHLLIERLIPHTLS